ncbi:MAG: hypothetical protein WD042_01990 [Phycisphaeraceae bacterium]
MTTRWFVLLITVALSGAVLAAQPPLTADQLERLSAATDRSMQVDEAALYPLLENAGWLDPAQQAGATIPDYTQIQLNPVEVRGQLFVIKGFVAAAPRQVQRTARSGPWDGKLEQWFIRTSVKEDHIVVVYLVDPPAADARPNIGDEVWIVARFYKVWQQTREQKDRKILDYLVFVGKSPNRTGQVSSAATGSSGPGAGIGLLLMLLLVAGVLFMLLRRKIAAGGPSYAQRMQERRQRLGDRGEQQGAERTPEGEPEPVLPKDPVEALRELERRHEEKP